MDTVELTPMAIGFFGYGRWEAPYWFIGPEPGMAGEIDTLEARQVAWRKLGGHAVVDCEGHHRGFGFTTWHDPGAPTQRTWRQLIRLLLAFKTGQTRIDIEDVRRYQIEEWGSASGESCVIELSGTPAPSLSAESDRTSFMPGRIKRIRHEIDRIQREFAPDASPKFVVMYGKGNDRHWEQIAGRTFDSGGFRWIGPTLAARTLHPNTRGLQSHYWGNLGLTIASKLRERSEIRTSASSSVRALGR